jgi:hypothetical protein
MARPLRFLLDKESRPWKGAVVCVHFTPLFAAGLLLVLTETSVGQEPPAEEPKTVNPFGPRSRLRDDAQPGYVELSDGTIHPGRLYLTREARLKIFDGKRYQEIALKAVGRIDCQVEKEWMEKEWRFKENASNEKVYTGRSYPARKYVHRVTLRDGKMIRGPLAAIVYVQGAEEKRPQRFLLHKRQKGTAGSTLRKLTYVRVIELGEEAHTKGLRRAEEYRRKKAKQSSAKQGGRTRSSKRAPPSPSKAYR